jgi:tRNA threonylcarbamoyladenosine biosynthesis protein TsaE
MIRQQKQLSLAEMNQVAESLAKLLFPGAFIALNGDLGSGKTSFAQGLLAALGVKESVQSPTFRLLQSYNGKFRVHHLDLYRLEHPLEVLDLGWDELQDGDALVIVEWMDRFSQFLPSEYLELNLTYAENGRNCTWTAVGKPYETLLKEMLPCES